jgi:hypothetical protein
MTESGNRTGGRILPYLRVGGTAPSTGTELLWGGPATALIGMHMAGAIRPRWKSAAAATLSLLTLFGLVTGCGKGEFTYVANQDEHTYYKVPSNWVQVDSSSADDYFLYRFAGDVAPDSQLAQDFKRSIWSAAFDASDEPTADHLVSLYPTDAPVLYSLILHLPEAARGTVSLDFLRDVFVPVSDQAAKSPSADDALPGYELLGDMTLTPGNGLHGVRVVYNFRVGGAVTHTFDLTSLTNDDASVLYVMLIRCTASCYRQHATEFDDIASSFTVRSAA